MRIRLIFASLIIIHGTAGHAGEAQACTEGDGAHINRVWPAADATDVPIDGVVVIVGGIVGNSGDRLMVEVDVGGQKLAGTLEQTAGDVWVWRNDGPFLPDTTYHVFARGSFDLYDFTFTTGSEPAGPPVAQKVVDLEVMQVRYDITECVMEGLCDCYETKVVDFETRMRADVGLPGAPQPFGEFNRMVVQVATGADSFTEAGGSDFAWPSPALQSRKMDLGLAGSWPGQEVCARISVIDPLGRRADGEATCVPIGEANAPPEDEAGCGCAATGDATPLALLLAWPLLRRRRAR